MSGFRVLAIPHGAERDAIGRGLGDDWLLATLGNGDDGTAYYVTTNRVRVSETVDLTPHDPKTCAQLLCDALNDREFHRKQGKLF